MSEPAATPVEPFPELGGNGRIEDRVFAQLPQAGIFQATPGILSHRSGRVQAERDVN